MRALMRLRRQGAKCVGPRPGGGQGHPASIEVRLITGRSAPDRARPSPGPRAWRRSRGATTSCDPAIGPARGTGCAARRQSARRAHRASLASDARFAGPGTCSERTDAPNSRPATAPTPPAARPSRTSAGAQCTTAAASTFANTDGTRSAALQPDCTTARRRCDRPCGGSSRVATARSDGSAGTHPGGRSQGSRRPLPNADRGW